MHVSLISPASASPDWLATALTELCEREGLDPCQTACMVIEALAWMPRLPQQRKPLPRSDGPTNDPTETIRQRAYEIWHAEGQPDGRALEHWCRAEAEVARR